MTTEPLLLRRMTWAELADGRVHRLKGGKHYPRGGADALKVEAVNEAERLGKRVRTQRDELGKWQYLWVQFADHTVPTGAACPTCEGHTILEQHEKYGRCATCGASLFLIGQGDAGRPDKDLRRYTDLNLRFVERLPGRERYAGSGLKPNGRPVLLIVDYYVDAEGQRIPDPARPGEMLHRLRFFPAEPFADALGLEPRSTDTP